MDVPELNILLKATCCCDCSKPHYYFDINDRLCNNEHLQAHGLSRDEIRIKLESLNTYLQKTLVTPIKCLPLWLPFAIIVYVICLPGSIDEGLLVVALLFCSLPQLARKHKDEIAWAHITGYHTFWNDWRERGIISNVKALQRDGYGPTGLVLTIWPAPIQNQSNHTNPPPPLPPGDVAAAAVAVAVTIPVGDDKIKSVNSWATSGKNVSSVKIDIHK
jgi:hypothetical protein